MEVLLERVPEEDPQGHGVALVGAVELVAADAFRRAGRREEIPEGGVGVEAAALPGAAEGEAVAVGIRKQGRHRLRGGGALVEEVATPERVPFAEAALQPHAVLPGV